MDYVTHEGPRWTIVYGAYEGVEKHALDVLYGIVAPHVPYILTVTAPDADIGALRDFNIIFLGTVGSNPYLRDLAGKGIFAPNDKKEGYAIKVSASAYNPGRQMVVLAGADENGVLYAVDDFEHYYIDPNVDDIYGKKTVFTGKMPEYARSSSPAVAERGFWTWGHVIYDYRKYLDNMAKWKLNFITIWNDFAPLNAKEVTDYAHSRGIKVIWAFSWCWGETDVDLSDARQLDLWTERVIHTYETQYAGLGGDGIYFQTLTETAETRVNGVPIAKLAVDWVNRIAGKLLEKYPGLWIKFGLHASSIKENYGYVAEIDPRLNITWEDAGAFPYAYDAADTENFAETLDYTSKISGLRGGRENFGIVVKGTSFLDWSNFEHQKGPVIIGCASEGHLETLLSKDGWAAKQWKHQQAYWIKNLANLLDVLKVALEKDINSFSAELMIDSGMWERRMWFPAALGAESLWNPYESPAELIEKVSLVKEVRFA
ncbi:MAG: hypothetical protein FWF44_11515 [Defluviitaleaceae bacterium]|nr:hypothetical protein [Defluviitaleaceae bacterium]